MKKIILFSSILALSAITYMGCQKEVASTKTDSIAIEEFAATTSPLPYTAAACETNCIDPADPVYFYQEDVLVGVIGGGPTPNTKTLTYKIWNDLTNLNVEVKYDRNPTTSGSTTCVKVTVGASTPQYVTLANHGSSTLTFTLPEGWDACDALSWQIIESATGCADGFSGSTAISGSGTYNLIGECDFGCEDEFTADLTCGDPNTLVVTFTPEATGPIVIQGGLTSGASIITASNDGGLVLNAGHPSAGGPSSVTRWEGTVTECVPVTITIVFSGGNGVGGWSAKRDGVTLGSSLAQACN